ncbi:hypothetical protein PMAYCL1PPCAC_22462, partial [Pristionchus mayeri]
ALALKNRNIKDLEAEVNQLREKNEEMTKEQQKNGRNDSREGEDDSASKQEHRGRLLHLHSNQLGDTSDQSADSSTLDQQPRWLSPALLDSPEASTNVSARISLHFECFEDHSQYPARES